MSTWGVVGDETMPRYTQPIDRTRDRRRHRCLCGAKRTHVGMANGVALMSGCEWCARLWVRDPNARPPRAS